MQQVFATTLELGEAVDEVRAFSFVGPALTFLEGLVSMLMQLCVVGKGGIWLSN